MSTIEKSVLGGVSLHRGYAGPEIRVNRGFVAKGVLFWYIHNTPIVRIEFDTQ